MKIYAKDETIAKLIKHPNGKGFKEDGSSDWPDDQFTKRRIRDGDITTEPAGGEALAAKKKEPSPPPPPPKSA